MVSILSSDPGSIDEVVNFLKSLDKGIALKPVRSYTAVVERYKARRAVRKKHTLEGSPVAP